MVIAVRALLFLAAAAQALCAQVSVSRTPEGQIVYRRRGEDPVFNRYGIGIPPRGTDPELWYAYDPYIRSYAEASGVDPVLAKAIIYCESRFHWKATSRTGARGLMQLMPKTAERMGHAGDPYDPIQNIRSGITYLAKLQTRYHGNLIKVAAAYNAGEGAVDRHGGVPPFKETKAYVPSVLYTWDWIQRPRG